MYPLQCAATRHLFPQLTFIFFPRKIVTWWQFWFLLVTFCQDFVCVCVQCRNILVALLTWADWYWPELPVYLYWYLFCSDVHFSIPQPFLEWHLTSMLSVHITSLTPAACRLCLMCSACWLHFAFFFLVWLAYVGLTRTPTKGFRTARWTPASHHGGPRWVLLSLGCAPADCRCVRRAIRSPGRPAAHARSSRRAEDRDGSDRCPSRRAALPPTLARPRYQPAVICASGATPYRRRCVRGITAAPDGSERWRGGGGLRGTRRLICCVSGMECGPGTLVGDNTRWCCRHRRGGGWGNL